MAAGGQKRMTVWELAEAQRNELVGERPAIQEEDARRFWQCMNLGTGKLADDDAEERPVGRQGSTDMTPAESVDALMAMMSGGGLSFSAKKDVPAAASVASGETEEEVAWRMQFYRTFSEPIDEPGAHVWDERERLRLAVEAAEAGRKKTEWEEDGMGVPTPVTLVARK
jgi:hypothetical protein